VPARDDRGRERRVHGRPGVVRVGFAASRAVLLVLVAVWQLRTPSSTVPSASYVCYSTSLVLWVVSIFVDPPLTYLLWAVSLLVEIVTRLREQSANHRDPDMPPVHVELLVERFGLIVMVALGEGVAGVGLALSDTDGSGRGLVAGVAAFATLAALWWWYFDFASTTVPDGYHDDPEHTVAIARDVHVFGHFVLVGAVVAVSAALRPVVLAVAHSTTAAGALGLACDGLVVIVLTLAAMTWRLGTPWPRVAVLLAPAAVLATLAIASDSLSPLSGLVAVVVTVVGAVALQRVALRWRVAHT
jgi:low temperature requirement protein LtrA